MTGAETEAAAHLAGRAAAGVASLVEGVHRAVSDRVERVTDGGTGGLATPIHAVQEVVTTGVYAAVRGGLALGSRAAGMVAARRASGSPVRDGLLVAALNGATGGLLAEEDNALAIPLRVEPVPPHTAKVAVLIHGLGESPSSWKHDPDYRTLLADLGWTPALVHYNSGRRIEHSGADLADELERLLASWPLAPVTDVALIGHSMGGLVARSSVVHGVHHAHTWVDMTSRLVTLGSPHEGAPLARLGHRARGWLTRLPETRPFGGLLDFARAPGIDDLRHGTVGECAAEWPEHIRVATIGATLHRNADHPVSRVLGDLLVTVDSATSAVSGRRSAEDAVHLGGLHHFDLLGHPEVAAELRRRLA
jgi:pimeloyl-ACP methyl ester carboxylesterase